MPITVRVQNFQSIVDATVVIDGFTVVTGANNSGKTALQRAIQGVFTNPPPGALVRQGAEFLRVTITFPDGNEVIWEKGEKVNRYFINGVKREGLGRGGVPDEVKALGVHDVKAGSDRIWPQIAPQFIGQVFLLDRPGSMLAEAVADVEKVGQLSSALKLADRDRRAALSDLKVRRKDEKDLQAELDGFDGLDTVDGQVTGLETLVKEAQTARDEVAQLNQLADDIAASQAEIDHLSGVEEVQLPEDALMKEAQTTRDEATQLGKLSGAISAAQAEIDYLSGVEEVQLPEDATLLAATQCGQSIQALLGLKDKLDRLNPAIERWEQAVEASQGVTLGDSEAVKQVRSALGFFVQMQDDLNAARDDIETLEGKLDEQQGYLDAQELVVEEVLAEMGACPVCHQRVGEVHDHAEGVEGP